MRRRSRSFLLALLAAVLPAVTGTAQHQFPDPSGLLRSGPMLGYAEMTESVIWLQTWRACRAQIRYWKQGRPESARVSEERQTGPASDHIARFALSHLEFGTKYEYEVYLDG